MNIKPKKDLLSASDETFVLFNEQSGVRRERYNDEWYYSVVDIIAILTGSENPRRYWSDLKRKLLAEGGNEVYEKIVQLKLLAPDGKLRESDT
jgi:hypothetical protein